MGEALITRRGGTNVSVKAFQPFSCDWYDDLGATAYRYYNCDFNGRTFLLFATSSNNDKFFAIIKNGIIEESYDSYAIQNPDKEPRIVARIVGTDINIEHGPSLATNISGPLLIEI